MGFSEVFGHWGIVWVAQPRTQNQPKPSTTPHSVTAVLLTDRSGINLGGECVRVDHYLAVLNDYSVSISCIKRSS